MIELSMGTLCNYAQMSEGLLTMVGGGVSAFSRRSFPAPMEAYFVLGMVSRPVETDTMVEVKIVVVQLDGANDIARLSLNATVSPPPKGYSAIPTVNHFVAALTSLSIPDEGAYEVVVSQDDSVLLRVPFFAQLVEGDEDDN